MHALYADSAHVAFAEQRFRCGEPDELHALFLGMAHFPRRARHVLAVAPVKAAHGLGALSHHGAHTIHGRIAPAHHDDMLADGVERAAVEARHRVTEALAIGGHEI